MTANFTNQFISRLLGKIGLLSGIFFLFSLSATAQVHYDSVGTQCYTAGSGGTQAFNFVQAPPTAIGPATVRFYYAGDVDYSTEIIRLYDENNSLIGQSTPTVQCGSTYSMVTFTIASSLVNSMAANGTITITGTGDASVNNFCTFGSTSSVAWCGSMAIEYPVVTGPNDAGVVAIDSPKNFCPGVHNIVATIRNSGNNKLDSVRVNWSFNGAMQPTIYYTNQLDTIGGTGASSAQLILGSKNFVANKADTIKVWTSMPNGVQDTVNLNDTAQTIVKPALAGTFTIGGASPDYANFTAAVNDLKNIGICGPVVFNVASGSGPYNEQIEIPAITGASATNTITFNGNGETLQFSSTTSTSRAVIDLNGVDYLTIDNLVIKANAGSYGWGILFRNAADYNTISNCNISVPVTSTSSNFIPVLATASTSSYSSYGNNGNYNTFSRNTISGGYYCMRWNGQSGSESEGNQFNDNNFQDFYYYGAMFYYTNNTSFVGNDINRMTRQFVSTMYGLYMYYSTNITVEKNKIHDSHTGATSNSNTVYCMYLYQCHGTNGNYSRVVNNAIYNINNNSTNYAIYHNNNSMLQYYHNSIVLDYQSATTGTIRGVYLTGAASGVDFRNNIVNITKSGTGTKHCLYLNSAIQSDNNVLYMGSTSGSNYVGYAGGNQTTFAQWQAANNGAYDQNGSGDNPQFANAGSADFTPTNPLVDNIGAPVGVTDDINGKARCAKPDPGAFENSLVLPPNDAGILSIDSPSTFCAGIQPIVVTVQNFGSTIINSVTVNWSINGTMQTPYALATPLDTSCGFGSSSAMITLGTNNFLNGVAYTIKVWTSNPNGGADTSNLNDTMEVVKQAALGGTFTIGGSNPDYATFTDAVNALNSFGVCSAVIFNVRPGTYSEQVEIGAVDGSDSVNTITFQSENGDSSSAILTYASTISTANYTVKFNGSHYVTFRQLTLQAGGPYGRVVDFSGGANHITVTNNRLLSPEVTTTSNYYAVVYNLSGSIEEYLTIRNNYIRGGSYACYMYGSNTTMRERGNVIEGNDAICYYYGFYNYYQVGTKVRYNRFQNTNATFGYGCYNYYVGDDIDYSGNWFNLTGGYGIYMSNCIGTASTRGCITNNMITIAGSSTAYGMYLTGSTSFKTIAHNSFNIRSTNLTSGRGIYKASSGSGMNFVNNIFANTGGGYSVYFTNSTGVDTMNYNNFYTTGFTLAYWGGNQFNLPALQLISGKDSNSISINPWYKSATDLHAGPTVNNRGMAFPKVTVDFDGEARNPLTPDIGADEFTPPPYDMTVLSATAPLSACGLTDIEPFTIVAMNFGTDTLQIGDTVVFSYSINGGPIVNEPHILTAPLGFLDTLIYTFSSVLDLSAPMDYHINVWPTTNGDFNYGNDTLYYFVSSIPNVVTYPYVEGFETGTGGWTVNGTVTSWELGTPAGNIIYTAANGNNSWMTDLKQGYMTNENGYVLGPCFDFTNLNKPQVSMSVAWDTRYSYDGAVFQASTDSGATWVNVGLQNDDINWFNDNTINGNPGGQQVGWTGNLSNGSLGWKSAKHSLDGLAGEPDVLFRVAFGSYNYTATAYDGFAFDDVVIGETPIITLPDTIHTCGWVLMDCGIPNGYYDWSTGHNTQTVFILADTITTTTTIDIYAEDAYGLYTEKTVVLILDPGPYVDLGNDTLICGDTVFTLDAGNPQMNYNWSTGHTSQTIDVSQNGQYSVEVMHNNGCTHEDSIVVTFEAFPIATFVYTDTNINSFVNFNSGGSYGSSYVWDFGDGNGAYIQDPKHYYTQQGSYTVTLTVENECGVDVYSQTITVVHIGIDDPSAFADVSVYPNPSEGLFTIDIATVKNQDIQLSLTNVQGQAVQSEWLKNVSNAKHTLDLSTVAKGIYYLKLQAGTEIIVKKLVIQ